MIITDFMEAETKLIAFFCKRGLDVEPTSVAKLDDIDSQLEFVRLFTDYQRHRVAFMSLTSVSDDVRARAVGDLKPHRRFVVTFLDLVEKLQMKIYEGDNHPELNNTYFDLVLFAQPDIGVDDVLEMVAQGRKGLIEIAEIAGSTSHLMVERSSLAFFLLVMKPTSDIAIGKLKEMYKTFKRSHYPGLESAVKKHGVDGELLNCFVDFVVNARVVEDEILQKLFKDNDSLGWKQRAERDNALMKDITPVIKFKAQGAPIKGLSLYR